MESKPELKGDWMFDDVWSMSAGCCCIVVASVSHHPVSSLCFCMRVFPKLTSTNGALCIINPLYLREHGDDWLTHRGTAAQCATQPSNYRRERRLSTTRMWAGAGIQSARTVSLDQKPSAASVESAGEGLTLSNPTLEGLVTQVTKSILSQVAVVMFGKYSLIIDER